MEDTKKGFNFIEWFRRMWTEHPLFSTACALLLMAILQIIALGFDQATFGDWLSKYLRNWINILRNNATIGIIALGMTFVIITGGIDLAVGSTLVAIGAIIMLFIDGSQTGSSLVNQAKAWTRWEATAQIQCGFVHSEAHSAENARQHERPKLASGVSQAGRCS